MTKITKDAQPLRRIDRNSVIGDKAAMLKLALSDETKSHFLYRVGGEAIGSVRGVSQYGDWIKLVGRFQAINNEGEIFTSHSCFLPPDGASMVDQKLSGDADKVTFLFDIFVRYDASLATSYGFIIQPVRKPDELDPLDEMFANAAALPSPVAQARLEAPTKTGDKATAKA